MQIAYIFRRYSENHYILLAMSMKRDCIRPFHLKRHVIVWEIWRYVELNQCPAPKMLCTLAYPTPDGSSSETLAVKIPRISDPKSSLKSNDHGFLVLVLLRAQRSISRE